MSRVFLFLFLFASATLSAQQDSLFRNIMLSPGINASQLKSDTLSLTTAVMPQFGVGTHGVLAKHVDLELAVQLSTRGGVSTSPYLKIRNVYTDFIAEPRVQLGQRVYLGAGLQYAMLLSSRMILLDGGKNGTASQKISGYKSQLEVFGAAQVQLWPRIGIEARYAIPMGSNATNFQLAAHIGFGFRRPGEPKAPTARDLRRRQAEEQVLELKNGVLLVRLQSGKARIDALRRTGHEDLAKKEEEKQQRLNATIAKAFQQQFSFCPVYFFYADQTSLLKAGKTDSLTLMNAELAPDNTLQLSGKPWLVAEFGVPDNGSSTSVMEGLLMRDTALAELPPPFPGFARGDFTTGKEETISATVQQLNRQLSDFYRIAKTEIKND